MKSVKYIFVFLFIIITLCSGIPSGTDKILTLQAGREVGSAALNQSADIISSRLKLYGVKSFDVSVSSDLSQLKIKLPESVRMNEIEDLLTAKGEMAFYATYTQDEIKARLNPDNKLFKLLNPVKDRRSSDPRIGCTDLENKKMAESYIASASALPDFKFVWQSDQEKAESCLFALKTEDGNPLVSRKDIESVKITDSNDGVKIMIKLKNSVAGIFAEATRINVNKALAIVIDEKVYSWPVLRDVIEKGEIEVTGSFTKNEVKYFPVIFNTAQLPVEFKLIK